MNPGKWVVLAVALVLIACGTNSETNIEAYMKKVCEAEELRVLQDGSPYQTWGQFHNDARRGLDVLEGITPPPILEEFHEAQLTLWRSFVGIIAAQDQASVTDDLTLLMMMEAWLPLSEKVNRAVEALPDDVFQVISETRCSELRS